MILILTLSAAAILPPMASTARAPAPLSAAEDEGESATPYSVEPARVETTDDFRSAVTAYERTLLEDALRRNRYNQRATATALGLSYDQLRHALKRHKLQDTAA